jgi:hypothetical protein
MSRRLGPNEILDRVAALLPHARAHIDEEADELELTFPGARGREGRAVLIDDDFYLRLDVDSNEPLSIIVPNVSPWLARLLAQTATPWEARTTDSPEAWTPASQGAVAQALGARLRASADLAAAVA